MHNFLKADLSPKVSCSSPATDNYEVDNLISDKYMDKLRGFIAYSSIKPPVEIIFQFIAPINLHYLLLNTTVGTQRCSGIEIFAKTSNNHFISIARAVYDKSGVVFCNSRQFTINNPPPNFDSECHHLAFFKSNTFRIFLNAAAIKVVIFRTEKSVPCLAAVEAWGRLSKSATIAMPSTSTSISPISPPPQLNQLNTTTPQSGEFTIPDDFKDDLTYEVMTIPMTLPSGKTVDQTTLEKHVASEKSFGRKPSDPFTGMDFTDRLKPVLNAALKSRIDMFLLQNSDKPETFHLKRTLGGRSSIKAQDVVEQQKRMKFEQISDNRGDPTLALAINRIKTDQRFCSFATSSTSSEICCAVCNKKHFENYYRTPCRHNYCRGCLLEICVELKCNVCQEAFSRSDVTKVNA